MEFSSDILSRAAVLNEKMEQLVKENGMVDLQRQLEAAVPIFARADVDSELVRFFTNVYTLGVSDIFDGDISYEKDSYRFGSSDLLESVSVALKSFTGLRDQHVLNKTNSVIFSDGTRLDTFDEYVASGKLVGDIEHFEGVFGVLASTVVVDEQEEVLRKAWSDFCENNNFVRSSINSTITEIIKVYELLFSKGFEVESNYAVTSLSEVGLLKIDPNSNKAALVKSVAFKKLNAVIKDISGVVEDKEHQQFNVAVILNSDKPVYFPLKMLEYASGRVATENVEQGHYKNFDGGAGWGVYADQHIRPNLAVFLKRAVRLVLTKHVGEADVLEFIKDEDNIIDVSDLLEQTFDKMYQSMTCCALVSSFEGDKEDWASIEIKINSGFFGQGTPMVASKLIRKIIDEARGGKGTVDGTAYEIDREITEGLGRQSVVTYSHTFDPVLANSRPLFSYQALDALAERGETITWDSVLLGKSVQGKMVISRKGAKVNFREQLFHFLIAGSRSGKGVSTMAFLLAALASGVPIFYLDKKPDISVILKQVAEMLGDDNMFLINGSGYEAQFDPSGSMNMDAPERKAKWLHNVPEWWGFRGEYHNTIMGDLVYYRAIMFCFGLLLVRFWAKSNDPVLYEQLNGDKGVLVVIDEFTKWQKSFSTQYLNPRGLANSLFGNSTFIGEGEFRDYVTAKHDVAELKHKDKKGAQERKRLMDAEAKVESIENDPRRAYAVDLYNNMQRTFMTLEEKKQAGFKGTEELFSDVFIVGQDLEVNGFEEGNMFERGASSGEGKLLNSGAYKGVCAVSSFAYNFSTDFIMGYNADKGHYMNADKQSSVTYGRLTATARNFAYIKATRDTVMNGTVDVINNNATVYKPYLILNEAIEPKVSLSMTDTEFTSACSQPDNTQYVGGIAKAIGKEQYFKLRPQLVKRGTDVLRDDIGFKGYLDRLIDQTGGQLSLSKSGDIANILVKQMGYPGTWFEFLCDLRPEWNFGAKDVLEAFESPSAFAEGNERLSMYRRIEQTKAEFLNKGGNTAQSENKGVTSSSISSDEDLPTISTTELKTPFKSQFDTYSELDEREQNLLNSEFSVDEDSEGVELVVDEEVEDDEEIGLTSSINLVSDDELEDDFTEDSEVVEPTVRSSFTKPVTKESQEALNDIIQTLGVRGFEQMPTTPQEQEFMRPLTDAMASRNTTGEAAFDKGRNDEKYYSSDKIEAFTEPFNVRRDTSDNFMMDYYTLVNIMSDNVMRVFGGVDNIESVRVISRKLVVNNSYFNANVPANMVKGLPKDRRSNVANGEFAELFDFRRLVTLPRLALLEVSTIEFFETRVAMDLNIPVGYKGVVELFKKIPTLRYIVLEGRKYSRDLSAKDIAQAENFFKSSAKRSAVADAFYERNKTWRKGHWDTTKELFKRKGFWSKLGGVGYLGATVVTGGAELGTNLARKTKRGFGDLLKAALKLDD